jgi:hypothetical protein
VKAFLDRIHARPAYQRALERGGPYAYAGTTPMTVAFSSLDAQRQAGGKLIVLLTWLMTAVVLAARLTVHGPILGLAIASVATAGGATLALRFARTGSTGRALTGVALMAQVSLLVAALGGHAWQTDMHMAYFAALALLVVYCDWMVIAAAAATVAVHHLGLSYLLPSAVFPGSASLGRVIVHAVILIIEAGALSHRPVAPGQQGDLTYRHRHHRRPGSSTSPARRLQRRRGQAATRRCVVISDGHHRASAPAPTKSPRPPTTCRAAPNSRPPAWKRPPPRSTRSPPRSTAAPGRQARPPTAATAAPADAAVPARSSATPSRPWAPSSRARPPDQPDHRRHRRDRLPDQPAGPQRRRRGGARRRGRRGFAVVAQEVRALAQRSADAAKEIKTLISSLGRAGPDAASPGRRDRRGAATIVDRWPDRRPDLRDPFLGREQAVGLKEVNTAVNQMDQVTQQNAAMVEETTAAAPLILSAPGRERQRRDVYSSQGEPS